MQKRSSSPQPSKGPGSPQLMKTMSGKEHLGDVSGVSKLVGAPSSRSGMGGVLDCRFFTVEKHLSKASAT